MDRRILVTLAAVGLVALAVGAPLVIAVRGDEPSLTQVVVAPGHDSFAIVTRSGGGLADPSLAAGRDDVTRWSAVAAFPWIERDAFHRDLVRGAAPGSTIALADGATLRVPAADHLRVVFVGDTGAGDAAGRVLSEAAAQKPDLVVHLGDVAYAYGDERVWDGWMGLVASSLPGVPIAYATGNHDVERGVDAAQMEGLRGAAAYYSFDAGPVHFVVLDSNHVDDAQARWLDRDLATAQAADAAWIVPVEHAPWYSSGTTHGSDVDAQKAFASLFAKHGVKLAVAGHEHNYERTTPIAGVTYVVTGGGGAALYNDFQSPSPAWSAARHEGHELVVIDFAKGSASARVLATDGSAVDAFTL
ncbi:MAG: acid phosphatase type 7 [Thermoplasmata archaeon]|nr:acid phosphatase type 7 [Thermoplasmata archaeon]